MNRWTFRAYLINRQDQIRIWYDKQPMNVQAEFLGIVMYLRDAPADDWARPDYAQLQGELEALGELRVITREENISVHYRIIGFMDEDKLEFTMLIADRKTRRFSYREIGAVALKRKSEVQSNKKLFSQPADWIFND